MLFLIISYVNEELHIVIYYVLNIGKTVPGNVFIS